MPPKKRTNSLISKLSMTSLLAATVALAAGCPAPPETVASVDVERYLGRWYQVAGYPFGPSSGQVAITADYSLREDGDIRVFNRGLQGGLDGPEDTIEGIARVVDAETNAKLSVTFPEVLGGLFAGEYWIIDLDSEEYSYAVVTDSLRFTLFILSRTPQMDDAVYDGIVERLVAQGFNASRIVRIAQPGDPAK